MTLLETGESSQRPWVIRCRFLGFFFFYHIVRLLGEPPVRYFQQYTIYYATSGRFFYIIMTSAYSTRDGSRTGDAFLLGPVSACCCNVTLGVRPTDSSVRVILMNDSRFVRAITVDIMQFLSGYSP